MGRLKDTMKTKYFHFLSFRVAVKNNYTGKIVHQNRRVKITANMTDYKKGIEIGKEIGGTIGYTIADTGKVPSNLQIAVEQMTEETEAETERADKILWKKL